MHVLETDLKAEKELNKMLEAINTQSELRLQSCEEEKDGELTRQLNTTNLVNSIMMKIASHNYHQ